MIIITGLENLYLFKDLGVTNTQKRTLKNDEMIWKLPLLESLLHDSAVLNSIVWACWSVFKPGGVWWPMANPSCTDTYEETLGRRASSAGVECRATYFGCVIHGLSHDHAPSHSWKESGQECRKPMKNCFPTSMQWLYNDSLGKRFFFLSKFVFSMFMVNLCILNLIKQSISEPWPGANKKKTGNKYK